MESHQSVYSSAVFVDGECSEAFDVQQGVAQGCSLSPILFSVFINGKWERWQYYWRLEAC